MERRTAPRTRTYIGGQVAFNERFSTMDCVVRNMSDAGAKLDFSGAWPVPDEIDLTLTQRKETKRVRVVWRRGDEAGVAIVQPRPASGLVQLDWARRLRICETEKSELQRRLFDLRSDR